MIFLKTPIMAQPQHRYAILLLNILFMVYCYTPLQADKAGHLPASITACATARAVADPAAGGGFASSTPIAVLFFCTSYRNGRERRTIRHSRLTIIHVAPIAKGRPSRT